MSESMIERVGKALAAAIIADDPGNPGRYELNYPFLETIDDYAINLDIAARAAIEAMREPTEAMKFDGSNATVVNNLDTMTDVVGAGVAWKAMIDAALSTPNTDKT